MIQTQNSSALDKLLEKLAQCFTPEVAQRVVNIGVDSQLQARVDDYADKANQGTLTEIERSEYEAIIDATDLIAILKAKARRILAQHAG